MFCPNCGKQISDNSKFCNFCGYQITNDAREKAQLVELSSKRYKKHILISFLIAIIGFILFIKGIPACFELNAGNNPKSEDLMFLSTGALMLLIGIIWNLIARILRWWHHG